MTAIPPTGSVSADDISTADLIGSGQNGSLRDRVSAWWYGVKNGDMGALPATAGLVVLTILFAVLSPLFLTPRNFAALLAQAAPLVMLGMALVFVILLGEIDLSAGTTSGVALCAFVVLIKPSIGINWMVALAAAIAIGLTIGGLIGFLVARVGIPSFVVTLGMFLGLQGPQLMIMEQDGNLPVNDAVLALSNRTLPVWGGWAMLAVVVLVLVGLAVVDRRRRTRAGVPNETLALPALRIGAIAVLGGLAVALLSFDRGRGAIEIVGVPIVVPIVLAVLGLGTLLLDRTRFGRYLYAIGGNPEASRRAGIKVITTRWIAFVICSGLAVLSGVFQASYSGNVSASFGNAAVLSGVAAAVVGGVSLFGGRGRLAHAAIGGLVIAIIANGLGLLGLSAGTNALVTGGVLILAAAVDAVSRIRAGKPLFRTN